MLNNLSSLLVKLLHGNLPDSTNSVAVSFLTPTSVSSPIEDQEINLFLFEIKENRDLRSHEGLWDSKSSIIRRSPMRIDCSYLVTTWSKDSGEEKIKKEHALLYEAFLCLNRFSTIPDKFLEGIETYSPPMMVTHMSGDRSTGEFWQALGIPPRPAFYLTVTIEMDLNDPEPKEKIHEVKKNVINLESVQTGHTKILVGLVRDKSQPDKPEGVIKSATVELLNTGKEKKTDADGYFLFAGLPAETYTVIISKDGFKTEKQSITVPTTTGDALVFELTPSTT